MYPFELEIKTTTESDTSAAYLDLSTWTGGQLHISIYGEQNWLFNVTINDISVIYVTAHRCAGGWKKVNLRWGS